MLVRSFTVNNISGTRHQPLLHAIRNLFVFVEYCHLLELYVKCAALYRTFIPQSFWNTRCGRPRGRKFHLTRSLVASEGWSLVRDRTNRKHCPSHEIWSYKRGGRWWGWSLDRGSTVPCIYGSSKCLLPLEHPGSKWQNMVVFATIATANFESWLCHCLRSKVMIKTQVQGWKKSDFFD